MLQLELQLSALSALEEQYTSGAKATALVCALSRALRRWAEFSALRCVTVWRCRRIQSFNSVVAKQGSGNHVKRSGEVSLAPTVPSHVVQDMGVWKQLELAAMNEVKY